MDLEHLREKIPYTLYQFAQLLEILISVSLIVAIFLSMGTLIAGLRDLALNLYVPDALHNFLALAFNVVIGVEFLKMLCRHNMSSAVEVLLFAIARQMVVEHTSPLENILMVAAIAILFATRKFLFIPGKDDKHPLPKTKKQQQPAEAVNTAQPQPAPAVSGKP